MKTKTIKQLFALSGNNCYFPKCSSKLIEKSNNYVIGEICHIKSQKPGGLRFDITQTETERDSFENLMLLCPTHHSIIDCDEESYTVERLLKMKKDHEAKSGNTRFELSEEIANSFIIKNNIITNSETNIFNPINSQFAKIIQNINPVSHLNSDITFEDLLEKIHSGSEKLSKSISETLKLAKKNGDSDLLNLCKSELTTWDTSNLPKTNYRVQNVYLSTRKISRVNNMTMAEFWRDLKSKPDIFFPKTMSFFNSVPDIEHNIESNKSIDPSKSYINLVQNLGDLFPDIGNPEQEINIYCLGTLYHDLLIGIKLNLANEIIKRII